MNQVSMLWVLLHVVLFLDVLLSLFLFFWIYYVFLFSLFFVPHLAQNYSYLFWFVLFCFFDFCFFVLCFFVCLRV